MIITLEKHSTGIHYQMEVTITGLLTEKDLPVISKVIKLVEDYNEDQNENA